ncbi:MULTISPECIES: CmcJ/NvfI family oxidoreductase [Fischerella]|uniref:Methyltransferase n=1 Tax=Fischerella muscicola CCMEE 5323 TaxID=2019572 RepID=A0A2N6JVE2_FISMU|nr:MULTISPECIES: CmcJ/NvfI family oxidoreductase [Fischerella]MBD2433993.1 methyltransferase [Fischerella sp. FACHB-380]PLZ83219.1 methyltransferase [Fischerella muscicola CCMEE 5323]
MSADSQVLDRPIYEDLPYVEANLNYLIPMAEKPVNYTYEPPPGIPRYSGNYQTYKLPIRNARSISQNISLDREGFAFTEHHTNVRDFYDEDEIRNVYYPEAEQLLKEVTGATKVVIFDHTLRNLQRFKQGENGIREPVKRVHNDFTAKSGYTRARLELAARGINDIDRLLQQRFAIINVWRAIAQPIQESPLTVCDAQSIAPTDLVASDLVYRDRVGETYAITYNPGHRWFYFPQMHREEALFIKCFDSAEDGRARFAAHTAFEDPTSPPNAPPRESIELRTLVFYPG